MNKFIITAACLGLGLTSCKKSWLNVIPLDNQVAVTTSDYDGLMNGANFYFYSVGGYAEAVEFGDELSAEAAYINSSFSLFEPRGFEYQAQIYQPSDNEPFDLQIGLSNMYTLNKIINEVDASTEGTDDQKAEIKAEAMATRAWTYFGFANYYTKPYQASTAATDPGFPIITQALATQNNFTRGSVQDTYNFMIQDLQAAIPILPVKAVAQTRMSKPAAEGLLGRIYLFMGKYASADSQFTASLADVATAGVTTLYNYNVTFGPGGSFLPISPTSGPASPLNNFNDETESLVFKVFTNTTYQGNQWGTDGLVLAPWAAGLFDPSDWRLQFYSTLNADGSTNPGGRLRKYGQYYTRFGLELPDLYLMAAECKARLNDLSSAKTLVETLRQNRLPAANAAVPADTVASQTAMIHFIIDERIREFAVEGLRWFDMRRLAVDPLFSGIQFIHTLYNDDAGNTSTNYPLSQPDRLTLQFSPSFMIANPNMENNP